MSHVIQMCHVTHMRHVTPMSHVTDLSQQELGGASVSGVLVAPYAMRIHHISISHVTYD